MPPGGAISPPAEKPPPVSRAWAFTINHPHAVPVEKIRPEFRPVFETQLSLIPHPSGLLNPTDSPQESKLRTDADVRSYLSTTLESLVSTPSAGVVYCVCGAERGESGTPHFQGYLYFRTGKSMKQVVSLLRSSGLCPERFGHAWSSDPSTDKQAHPHVAGARGNAAQNKAYCTKDELWAEAGREPKQGERTDLATVGQELLDGLPLADAIARYPGIALGHLNNMQLIANRCTQPYADERRVYWFYGPTECGKSRRARQEAEKLSEQLGKPYYWRTGNTKWWCSYKGEEIAVLDDIFAGDAQMDTEELNFSDMLRLTDRYGTFVNQKGTSSPWQARYIFITCSDHPKEWRLSKRYGARDVQQLVRRINTIVKFKRPVDMPVREPIEIEAEWDEPLDLIPAPPAPPPVIDLDDDDEEDAREPARKRPRPDANEEPEEEDEAYADDEFAANEHYAPVRSPVPRHRLPFRPPRQAGQLVPPNSPQPRDHYDERMAREVEDCMEFLRQEAEATQAQDWADDAAADFAARRAVDVPATQDEDENLSQ